MGSFNLFKVEFLAVDAVADAVVDAVFDSDVRVILCRLNCHLTFETHHLPSVIRHLLSVICHLSSDIRSTRKYVRFSPESKLGWRRAFLSSMLSGVDLGYAAWI